MPQPFPIRRAALYRQRAQELTETAKQLRDACDRKHLLDQAGPPSSVPLMQWRQLQSQRSERKSGLTQP